MKLRFAWIAALFVAAPAFASYVPTPVYTDSLGREWIDIGAAAYRSWGSIATYCDSSTGACNGVLPPGSDVGSEWGATPTDLSGYTWATGADVVSMLSEVGTDVWDYFSTTCCAGYPEGTFSSLTNGFTREGMVVMTTSTSLSHPVPYWEHDLWSTQVIGEPGQPYGNPDFRDITIGGWFFRDPVAVPEPGSLALLVAGLGAMFATRRRRDSTSQ